MSKKLLSGNEAIALGAYQAGATVGTGYPGTPSTEILENFKDYPGVYAEWSVNEKVALEVAIGASLAGSRSLCTMKHVGLNVASDPLFTASYIGVKGGLVIINADDPNMHSSQNEQDNRHYAMAAKLPMLEPADSDEAYRFIMLAFELSEQYDTPVIIRTTTRISHAKSVVQADDTEPKKIIRTGFDRQINKYVMIPLHARERHMAVEKRMETIAGECNTLPINQMEINDPAIGFITSGICYHYVKENDPQASILKIGMVYPLPFDLIRQFSTEIERCYIVEELDPFLEMQIKSQGIKAEGGKKIFPITGELSPDLIRRTLNKNYKITNVPTVIKVPPRPPGLCPGCPHRAVFTVLHRLGVTVTGDIGCYSLGAMPPFTAMDTCIDMGASIGVAQGIEIAVGTTMSQTVVAVIGDSTFAHSGITGLLNAAYNNRHSLIIVLDNNTTAMTGMQPNPMSGERINGEPAIRVDYQKLAESIGIGPGNYRMINSYKTDEIENTITELLATQKLSLLVVKDYCIIWSKKKKQKGKG